MARIVAQRAAVLTRPAITLVSEHWKVTDDSLAPRVLAEGGTMGFLEHAGGVLLLRLAVLELRQHLHQVSEERAVMGRTPALGVGS
jgi:hypothetical protein